MPARRGLPSSPARAQTQTKSFEWEDANYTYPTGFATVVRQMKLEKRTADGVVETWRIEVDRAPEGKTFYKDDRGVVNTIDSAAKPIFPRPTFEEFYHVKQSFVMSGSKDSLGGFQSGLDADVTSKQKLDEWLISKQKDGFKQVPYKQNTK